VSGIFPESSQTASPSTPKRKIPGFPNFTRVTPCETLSRRHGDGHGAPRIFPEVAAEAERGSLVSRIWGRARDSVGGGGGGFWRLGFRNLEKLKFWGTGKLVL